MKLASASTLAKWLFWSLILACATHLLLGGYLTRAGWHAGSRLGLEAFVILILLGGAYALKRLPPPQ